MFFFSYLCHVEAAYNDQIDTNILVPRSCSAETLESSMKAWRLGGVSRNILIGAGGLRNILMRADVLSSIPVEFHRSTA